MNRMTSFLEKQGKKIIGWDEILEGEVADNAIVMSWRGTAGGIKAAQMGHDAIMTPNSYFYLDYYQSLDKDNEPLAIGGYLPVETCYSYEPHTAEMTDEEKAHILGVQANLWTEYIGTNEHLEYMLLPRLAALSEVQWCQPETKSWERFLDSADEFCAIYDAAGYNYAKHIFDVKGSVSVENNNVYVHLEAQGETPIRYTVDGSVPTEESTPYEGPVAITGDCTFKAKAFRPGTDGVVYEKVFEAHKAMAKDITVNTQAHDRYRSGMPYILIDGMKGPKDFHSKEWSGWRSEPLDVVLDMAGQTYSSLTLSTTIVKYDDIFNPEDITVYTSENGEDFTEIAKAEYPVEGENEPNGDKEYALEFPETSARYLKVTANPVQAKPQWHERPGTKGFLFVDEIIVR
jgi:hexosaminidase